MRLHCKGEIEAELGRMLQDWVLVWGLLAQLLNEVLKRRWGDSLGLRRGPRGGQGTELSEVLRENTSCAHEGLVWLKPTWPIPQ